jgi:dihydroflavonol-4-reductase
MPKAMLTGATGFVGGALFRELLRRNWEVRVLVRATSDRRNLEGYERRFECITGDIADRESVRRAMDGCDTVFHVAARYTLWNLRPDEVYRDNVEGTRNVLEVAGDLGVRRIVHTSTVGVLGAPCDGRPANESSWAALSDLQGHYKRSKWQAEECARDLAAKGLPVVIVNPASPVGSRDIKPTPTGKIILDFLRGRMFACTQTGLNVVPVEDVATGHILAAEKGVPGERYILGGENLSLARIFGMLADITGRNPPRVSIPPRLLLPMSFFAEALSRVTRRPPLIPWEAVAMAQRHMYFDNARARRELGFAPGDVKSALERAVQWFRENGYLGGRASGAGAAALVF